MKRVNNDTTYVQSKERLLANYNADLEKQSKYDIVLYMKSVERFCEELHQCDLWKCQVVKEYWKLKAPFRTSTCP